MAASGEQRKATACSLLVLNLGQYAATHADDRVAGKDQGSGCFSGSRLRLGGGEAHCMIAGNLAGEGSFVDVSGENACGGDA